MPDLPTIKYGLKVGETYIISILPLNLYFKIFPYGDKTG